MDWAFLGQLGVVLCFGLGAVGSALGIWTAGMAAAGAWAKDARAGKPISFTYVIFVAAPLSQTLYAMIVMNQMNGAFTADNAMALSKAGLLFGIGLACGLGELFSAWGQGKIGAAACRCLSEGDGKGLAFLIIAIGIIETVGIFSFAFLLGMVPAAQAATAAVGQ
jgi:V/A-type H+-transporting ATPase subunit K